MLTSAPITGCRPTNERSAPKFKGKHRRRCDARSRCGEKGLPKTENHLGGCSMPKSQAILLAKMDGLAAHLGNDDIGIDVV